MESIENRIIGNFYFDALPGPYEPVISKNKDLKCDYNNAAENLHKLLKEDNSCGKYMFDANSLTRQLDAGSSTPQERLGLVEPESDNVPVLQPLNLETYKPLKRRNQSQSSFQSASDGTVGDDEEAVLKDKIAHYQNENINEEVKELISPKSHPIMRSSVIPVINSSGYSQRGVRNSIFGWELCLKCVC